MKNQPVLTIAIPIYNGERTIKNMLDILMPQCNEKIEVLVSDNCSTDSTPNIIKEYQNKWGNISYWCNENYKCEFYPYLGTNDHFADIEYLGVEEAQTVIQDDYRIDSFMAKDNIEFIEKNSRQLRKILSEDEIESYSRFKYEEALPKSIDAEVNNYKLERFVYTNGFVKFLDSKQVYSISNQDNKEAIEAKKRKNIVFY